ncbi:MAG TPA: DNA replication/repair protein RecF [Candidatus Cybelea sp.]|nr:DNA replication/repair protein RecF [Candidatus Cybelea sp.]
MSGSLKVVSATAAGANPAAERNALAVRRLSLGDFRCYAGLRLDVDGRPVVLTGANGAGKTNLLEAISFLSPGRGLRRARLAEPTRRDAPNLESTWAVHAALDGLSGPVEIGTGLVRDGAGEADGTDRRVVKIDGQVAIGPSALAEVMSLVWLTPQMDRLFLEGASGRRRFLDRLVFGLDPSHASASAAYDKAMRERTRLLKSGGADPLWLSALEDTMAQWGVAVAAARRAGVAQLSAAMDAAECGAIGAFPRAHLSVAGLLEAWLGEMPAGDAEDRFRAALNQNRLRDTEAGGATEGPHRSDLRVTHTAKDMPAEQCSTGEQKALLIGIVLANARLQAARRAAVPVLLLDEVAAHLDGVRRAALFEALLDLGAQAWLTGTDIGLFEGFGSGAQFFTVRDGRLIG